MGANLEKRYQKKNGLLLGANMTLKPLCPNSDAAINGVIPQSRMFLDDNPPESYYYPYMSGL